MEKEYTNLNHIIQNINNMEELDLSRIETVVEELGEIVPVDAVSLESFPTNTEADYVAIKDSFTRYGVMLEDACQIYRCACQMAAVTSMGRSESINRMTEPFRKGFFTLAVVGKMSSGKSTFINALLNDRLLPTGHFQTTCTLTTIQHSEHKALHVLYGDNHEVTYTDDIAEKLKKLVAIPEEYKDVPVNNINRLILAGKTLEEVCGKDIIDQLEFLSKSTIEVSQVKKYYEEHPKEVIPKAVCIECPLLENYRGWRIVDTPGVDAIGGIEDDTKQFLCGCDENGNHNVDAIIFVQSGKDNIEARTFNEFVCKTMDSLTEEAKSRAFFVLTHATSTDFVLNQEEIMCLAKRLFVDYSGIGIDEKRLIAVDSLASLLSEDNLLDLESLVVGGQPFHWTDVKEWKICRRLLLEIKITLQDEDKVEFCNENIRRKLRDMANFNQLRALLDDFVREEKQAAFNTIISFITQDIQDCIAIKEKDIKILESNLGKSPKAFKAELEAEKDKLDDFQQLANTKIADITNTYSKSAIDKRFQLEVMEGLTLETFKSLSSFYEMRKKAEEIGSAAKLLEKSISQSIRDDIEGFIQEKQKDLDIVMPAIDIAHIEHEARKASTTYRTETYRVRKKDGFVAGIGRIFGGLFGTDWGYETATHTITHHDTGKEHDEQATKMFAAIKDNMDAYRMNLLKELQLMSDNVATDLSDTISRRKADYDAMAEKASLAEEIESKQQQVEGMEEALARLDAYQS